MFSKSLVILLATISIANVALASPHLVNRRHHHALAARGYSVARNGSDQLENRALRKRCRSRSPPSSAPVNAAPTAPVNVAPTTTASSSSVVTPPEQQTPPPPPPPPATSTSSTQQSAPTQENGNDGQDKGNNQGGNGGTNDGQNTNGGASSGSNNGGDNGGSSGGGNLNLPSFAAGTLNGQGTFYDTGLTACGDSYSNSDSIVALSKDLFDIWPGANGNPNQNPICNRMIQANYNGKSVQLKVVDRCEGCKFTDIDMTEPSFSQLADPGVGRLTGVTWNFIS